MSRERRRFGRAVANSLLCVARLGALAGLAALAAIHLGNEYALAQVISPSIAPSKVQVNDMLKQGQEVSLPPLSVGMPGNSPATIEINVLHVGAPPELMPSESWFRFEPQRFETQPGKNAIVQVHLTLPREAKPGDYKALLQAKAVRDPAAPTQGGVGISGAVASTVLFSVADVDFYPWDPVVNFFRERAPFSYVGAALLAGSLAVALFQSRYGVDFDFRLRRKQ
jgi:hypothetical protein